MHGTSPTAVGLRRQSYGNNFGNPAGKKHLLASDIFIAVPDLLQPVARHSGGKKGQKNAPELDQPTLDRLAAVVGAVIRTLRAASGQRLNEYPVHFLLGEVEPERKVVNKFGDRLISRH